MSESDQNKQEYRKFCAAHPEIPLFLQNWWLDVVCGAANWMACVHMDGAGNIQGVMPVYQRTFMGFQMVRMPPLTPYMGAWLVYPQQLKKQSRRHSFEKKVLEKLIAQLPVTAYYTQCHPPQLRNWLPFYWKGYKQTTRYSFILYDLADLQKVERGFDSNVRNKIRKAEGELTITETTDVDLFYRINAKTFAHQQMKVPYELTFFKRLDAVLAAKERRKILLAKDQAGQYHAAIYLIWDERVMYNLALGADPAFRSGGAVQLLLWKGIQEAAARKLRFDFEGSMMQNIESLFAAFGGKPQPYFKIYKSRNRFLDMLLTLKGIG